MIEYLQIRLRTQWANPNPGLGNVMSPEYSSKADSEVLNRYAKDGWEYVGPGTHVDYVMLRRNLK